MARRCRLKSCRAELPSVKESNHWQKQNFCNVDHMAAHGLAKARQQQERARLAKVKQERAEHRAAKQRIKTRKDWVNDAQRILNQIVVLEDREFGCITCPDGVVTDSGHYFHRGNKYRVSPLTLLRLNLNGQCELCNRWEGGKQHEYREGFIERYGEDKFNELVEFKRQVDSGEIPPLTIEQCRRLIEEFKVKKRQLERAAA